MPDADVTIRLDQGGVNARILAKEAKVDFRRVESASRKIPTTFRSPEVKRLFARYFNTMQLNMYLISVIARTKLPHPVIEKIESSLEAQLENVHTDVDAALDAAELLCKTHGITRTATYDTEGLSVEVRVISALGRRYLELMTKVDRLMPILETLAIDGVIKVSQLDLQKAMAKKSVRQVAGAARNLTVGLRRRMSAAAAGDAAQAGFGANQRSVLGTDSPDAQIAMPTDHSEETSAIMAAPTDSVVDSAAITLLRTQTEPALTSTNIAPQASAPA